MPFQQRILLFVYLCIFLFFFSTLSHSKSSLGIISSFFSTAVWLLEIVLSNHGWKDGKRSISNFKWVSFFFSFYLHFSFPFAIFFVSFVLFSSNACMHSVLCPLYAPLHVIYSMNFSELNICCWYTSSSAQNDGVDVIILFSVCNYFEKKIIIKWRFFSFRN